VFKITFEESAASLLAKERTANNKHIRANQRLKAQIAELKQELYMAELRHWNLLREHHKDTLGFIMPPHPKPRA
jgi:hypothetical protein